LTFAQQRVPSAAFYQLNALSMPFEDEFDVIGAFDVIEHIKDDERVLSQMFQGVKPGGGIALTVPQHRFLWSVADVYKHHERRYERSELIEKVERAGFRVAYATSFVSLFLPVMLLSRLKQNSAEETPDRLTEINIGRTVNKILNPVMRFETSLIKSGVNWPAGGSLLLIAKKGNST
jgi:SAM-dependent methyltransferase